jgi:hypothetical protein
MSDKHVSVNGFFLFVSLIICCANDAIIETLVFIDFSQGLVANIRRMRKVSAQHRVFVSPSSKVTHTRSLS